MVATLGNLVAASGHLLLAANTRPRHPTFPTPGSVSRILTRDNFESICESCTFFVTTIEFRPTLEAQRDDAAAKGQDGRKKIFDGLLDRLGAEAS